VALTSTFPVELPGIEPVHLRGWPAETVSFVVVNDLERPART